MRLAAVITVSDRSAAGERPDTSGPIAVAALRDAGYELAEHRVIPDGEESVAFALRDELARGVRLIVTSGGTGLGPRDRTPEGTRAVIEREVPGIPEALRRQAAHVGPSGLLSRGLAGVVGDAFVVNLPGSPGAVRDGMPLVVAVAAHILDQLEGGDH